MQLWRTDKPTSQLWAVAKHFVQKHWLFDLFWLWGLVKYPVVIAPARYSWWHCIAGCLCNGQWNYQDPDCWTWMPCRSSLWSSSRYKNRFKISFLSPRQRKFRSTNQFYLSEVEIGRATIPLLNTSSRRSWVRLSTDLASLDQINFCSFLGCRFGVD